MKGTASLHRERMIARMLRSHYDGRYTDEDIEWITVENGTHVPLVDGVAVGGPLQGVHFHHVNHRPNDVKFYKAYGGGGGGGSPSANNANNRNGKKYAKILLSLKKIMNHIKYAPDISIDDEGEYAEVSSDILRKSIEREAVKGKDNSYPYFGFSKTYNFAYFYYCSSIGDFGIKRVYKNTDRNRNLLNAIDEFMKDWDKL